MLKEDGETGPPDIPTCPPVGSLDYVDREQYTKRLSEFFKSDGDELRRFVLWGAAGVG